jgi:hypothetical protein
MHFSTLKADWEKIDFNCDSVVIRNLIHPKMNIHIVSNFPLQNINSLLDENALRLQKVPGK